MVEQEAVNFKVAGSSPAPGANKIVPRLRSFFIARPYPRGNAIALASAKLPVGVANKEKEALEVFTFR